MESKCGYLISRIKLLNARVFNRLLMDNNMTDFTGEQGKILYSLWQQDGITITSISEYTGLALNTLTTMLDNMEKSELLKRVPSKQDKRKKIVYLTEKGKELEKSTLLVDDKMGDIVYKGFSKKDVENFENYLYRVLDNLMEAEKQ